MGFLLANRVQRKVRYVIHYSHIDIELDYESDIDEFGPNNCGESFPNLGKFEKVSRFYIF